MQGPIFTIFTVSFNTFHDKVGFIIKPGFVFFSPLKKSFLKIHFKKPTQRLK